MTLGLFGKALIVWVGILVLAVVNGDGAIREAVIIPAIGLKYTLILSGVLLMLLIIGVTYLALPWMEARKITQLILIGLGWLCLTLTFEFSFGLLQGKSLPELLSAYTFKGGNIWPLVSDNWQTIGDRPRFALAGPPTENFSVMRWSLVSLTRSAGPPMGIFPLVTQGSQKK
jgi:hypothetical protein